MSMWLVVGLGNPGSQYRATRHNVGFMVLDELLRRCKNPGPARNKFGAEIAEGEIGGERTLLCRPMEFMNASGQAVARTAQFWKVTPGNAVVVYDDLDLPFGRLKLGAGGGHGGHNGVRSIIADWGSADFLRVRVGIGRPTGREDASGHVLAGFSPDEQAQLPELLTDAAEAVETIIGRGLSEAMNRFNPKSRRG